MRFNHMFFIAAIVLFAAFIFVAQKKQAQLKPLWLDEVHGLYESVRGASVSGLILHGAKGQGSPSPLDYLLLKILDGVRRPARYFYLPPQVYFRLQSIPTYDDGYFQFLRHFFDVRLALYFPQFITDAPPYWLFRPGHLWFLNYLFVYTLLLLPLFLHLRRPGGQRLVERLAVFCSRRWAILSLAIPFGVIEAALQVETGPGGWNRYAYLPIIVYGYLVSADGRFEAALRQHWKSALIMGLLAFVVLAGAYVSLEENGADPLLDYDMWSVLWRLLKGVDGWFLMVAIMGLAMYIVQPGTHETHHTLKTDDDSTPKPPNLRRRSSFIDHTARYAKEAQLPCYILHQTVIVAVGFYVIQWRTGILSKYLVISLSSLAITLALYDIGVKRTRLTRFLFGMRLKKT